MKKTTVYLRPMTRLIAISELGFLLKGSTDEVYAKRPAITMEQDLKPIWEE